MSKTQRHDARALFAEPLWSFQEPAAPDRAEPATRAGALSAQLKKFHQLNEYCDQAVAEIRASLERSQTHRH